MMSIRERFEEIGVMPPQDLPMDYNLMVEKGLMMGRVLCIVRHTDPETGVIRNTWSFLNEPEDQRR